MGNRETQGESKPLLFYFPSVSLVRRGKKISLRSRLDLPFAVARSGEEERVGDRNSVLRRPKPLPGPYDSTERHPWRSGGVPIQQTIFRDTPAPFCCVYCGDSGVVTVKSKPSLAAVVGCMLPMMVGICFLCPSMDCLWHKYHYCPSCKEKVADFEKSDPCAVLDGSSSVESAELCNACIIR